MNAVIKRGQSKKMDVADCIEHLQKEVNNQQSMKKIAMISCGELSVAEDFSSFLIDEDEFFKMSKQQQQSAFKKFCDAPLSQRENALTAPDVQIEIHGNQGGILRNLSVQPSQACITCVPHSILEEMFFEANALLEEEGGIHKFGHNTSYYVQDKTRNGWAVHVKISGRGEVSCDTTFVYAGQHTNYVRIRLRWREKKPFWQHFSRNLPKPAESPI